MKVRCLSIILRKWPIVTGIAALLSLWITASGYEDAETVHRLRADGTIQSLEYFIADALLKHPGRVIDAKLNYENRHNHYLYEILLLDHQGEVWELEYDACTGTLIENHKDWD